MKEKITKEEYERVKEEYFRERERKNRNPSGKKEKQKKFFKFGKIQQMNKTLKKSDEILVFLLNLKKQIEGPIVTKIYGGNFLVIRNHVYRFNPDRVFSFGKYKAVIAREFDRELVGIEDYEELVTKDFISKNPGGRVNIDDPVLIKALIAAKLTDKPKQVMNGKWIIIALAIVGLIIGIFVLTKPKATAPTVAPG